MTKLKGFTKAITLLVLMLLFCMALSACTIMGSNIAPPIPQQNPVFLGLTVSEYNDSAVPKNAANEIDGDHTGRDLQIDQDNPFESGYTVYDAAVNTFQINRYEDVLFYTNVLQKIKVTVNLSNPDGLDILSLTLNGEKITSDKFIDPDNKTKLSVVRSASDKSGYQTFEIDEIRFAKRESIESVDLTEGQRAAKIGIRATGTVTVAVRSEQIMSNAISFVATITDNFDLIQKSKSFAKAVLFDGNTIIQSHDLNAGVNAVDFNGLKSSVKYQYAIIANFDSSLSKSATDDLVVLHKKAFFVKQVVLFDHKRISVDKSSVRFDFVWDESITDQTITKLTISGDGMSQTEFSGKSYKGLQSNTSYTIEAQYKDLNGTTQSITLIFKTEAIAPPSVKVENIKAGKEDLSFDLVLTDDESAASDISLEVLKGTAVVKTLSNIKSLTGILISSLYSDTNYTLRAAVSYDLKDGAGVQTKVNEKSARTLAKSVPSISFSSVSASDTSVDFDLNITDPDGIGQIKKISVVESALTLVSLDDLSVRTIDGLSPHTSYMLYVEYSYNLNKGEDDLIKTATYDFSTLAGILLEQTKIMNTAAVTVGETVYLEVKLDNKKSAKVKTVNINGVDYSPLSTSSATSLKFEFVVDEMYAGGETDFLVDYIVYTDKQEKDITQYFDSNNRASVFVHGEMYVKELWVVDKNLNVLEYAEKGSDVSLHVALNNKTRYNIDEVQIDGAVYTKADLTMLSNGDVILRLKNTDYLSGICSFNINSITYSGDYLASKTKAVSGISSKEVVFIESGIVYVSTAGHLQSMTNDRQYVLKNDIDLSGIEWIPSSFNGIFDGNGYTIKNLTRVATSENEYIQVGLFSSLSGIVRNLNIDNATFMIESIGQQSVYMGALAGTASFASLSNVTITNSTLSVKKLEYGTVYIGGLFGRTSGVVMLDSCSSDASVSHTFDINQLSESYAGGLIGYALSEHDVIVNNCALNGNVSGYVAGGLIGNAQLGYGSSSKSFSILDSKVYGTVKGYTNAGGLVGYLYNQSANRTLAIERCEALGNVEAANGIAGGLIGRLENNASLTIRDCASYGNVKGTGHAGGLIAYFSANSNANASMTIERCYSSGSVESTSEFAGGLIGSNYNSASLTFKNCASYGSIKGRGNSGGLIGYLNANSNASMTIERCSSSGDVESTNEYAGGLIGGIDHNTSLTIRDCASYGSVKGKSHAGGLIGYIHVNPNASMTIERCSSSGDVESTSEYAGGLIGYNYYNSASLTIRDCAAYGNVKGMYYVGGLVGHLAFYSNEILTIERCLSFGSVSATEQGAGGLIGYLSFNYSENLNEQIIVRNCLSTGTVKARYDAGNIFGYYDRSNYTIKNLYRYSAQQVTATDGWGKYTEGTSTSLNDLNSTEFYITKLGLDTSIWDMSNLSFSNKDYVLLK